MLLLLTGKGVIWFIASNVKKTTKCSECTKNGPKSPSFCRRLRFLCNFAHRALLPKKRDIWSGGRAKKTSAGIYLFMIYCMVNLTVHCVQQVWSVFWYRYHYIQKFHNFKQHNTLFDQSLNLKAIYADFSKFSE